MLTSMSAFPEEPLPAVLENLPKRGRIYHASKERRAHIRMILIYEVVLSQPCIAFCSLYVYTHDEGIRA
jgi:hypothetical protein